MDLRDAERLSQYGAIAALLAACLNAAMTLNVLYNLEKNFGLTIWEIVSQDYWVFLDAGVLFFLAIAVFRYSRAAAVFLVLYHIADRAAAFAATGNFRILIFGVILLYFFVNAVRGTFAYHKLMAADEPDYRPIKTWHFLVGVPSYIIVGGILSLSLIDRAGLLPQFEAILTNANE